jgi:hypothetical protein
MHTVTHPSRAGSGPARTSRRTGALTSLMAVTPKGTALLADGQNLPHSDQHSADVSHVDPCRYLTPTRHGSQVTPSGEWTR